MLSCRKARRLLSPYLDGALKASERERLEAHLPSCPACRAELELLRRAMVSLRLHGPRLDAAVSEGLAGRAWERARMEAVPASVWAKLALSGALSLSLLMWGAHLLASKAASAAKVAPGMARPLDIERLSDEQLARLGLLGLRLAMLPRRGKAERPARPGRQGGRPRTGKEGASMLFPSAPKAAEIGKERAVAEVARLPSGWFGNSPEEV